MYQVEVLLGSSKRAPPTDSDDDGVNQTVLDRFFLADTVFRIFGGGIDQPRPDCMPEGGLGLVLVWFGLAWFGLVRYGSVWFVLVWFGFGPV